MYFSISIYFFYKHGYNFSKYTYVYFSVVSLHIHLMSITNEAGSVILFICTTEAV